MTSLLNRVVWSALTTRQDHFSRRGTLARRFDPEISPFAASKDNSADALAALTELICPGDKPVFLLQAEQITLPELVRTRPHWRSDDGKNRPET
ncbi:hypothetical protein [Roseibium album]|uniref:hypothetical protein n=1 Tax=Roseibium album TaxID=311410 RepID=UPI00391CE668